MVCRGAEFAWGGGVAFVLTVSSWAIFLDSLDKLRTTPVLASYFETPPGAEIAWEALCLLVCEEGLLARVWLCLTVASLMPGDVTELLTMMEVPRSKNCDIFNTPLWFVKSCVIGGCDAG